MKNNMDINNPYKHLENLKAGAIETGRMAEAAAAAKVIKNLKEVEAELKAEWWEGAESWVAEAARLEAEMLEAKLAH